MHPASVPFFMSLSRSCVRVRDYRVESYEIRIRIMFWLENPYHLASGVVDDTVG